MKKNKNTYALFYAALLGVVCALIPTAVLSFTAPYWDANAKAEEIRNVLEVLEIPYDKKSTSKELVNFFKQTVKEEKLGAMQVYVSSGATGDTQNIITAIPIAGPGIWGPIKGFLGMKPDMKTIEGITFYEQEETPGLGGEIGTPSFRNKFKGKMIVDVSGTPGFHIRRTGANGQNEIDGISGATLTCGKVNAILNGAIAQISKENKHE